MIPDIVEIKRLCASGQWIAKVENGKILLHDTVAGETVCIGKTEAEPVRRHGCWFPYSVVGKPLLRFQCSACHHWVDGGTDRNFCPNCGAKMDGWPK